MQALVSIEVMTWIMWWNKCWRSDWLRIGRSSILLFAAQQVQVQVWRFTTVNWASSTQNKLAALPPETAYTT